MLNSLDLLQGKSAEQFNINTTEFFELVFNDCKQRVMNLDNERGRSFGLAKVLDTYSSNTNRYKMPILGTVNQRENDYIVAVLMNCCMNSIIDKIFKSGIQRAIYLANTYSSRELKMTLDSVVTSQCTIRLSIYSGDVFGIR